MQNNSWARLLAVTGLVNHRLLLQCEYLAAENRILRAHLPCKVRLSDSERRTLAEIGKRLGRKLRSNWACSRIRTWMRPRPKMRLKAARWRSILQRKSIVLLRNTGETAAQKPLQLKPKATVYIAGNLTKAAIEKYKEG